MKRPRNAQFRKQKGMKGKAVLLRILATFGSSVAQNHLGYCWREGIERPVGINCARIWFNRAAKQGDENALANLRRLFDGGQGVPKSQKR